MTLVDKIALYTCLGILMSMALSAGVTVLTEEHPIEVLTASKEPRLLRLETEVARLKGTLSAYENTCVDLNVRVHVLETKYTSVLETFIPARKAEDD